jgi:hypothetical protein
MRNATNNGVSGTESGYGSGPSSNGAVPFEVLPPQSNVPTLPAMSFSPRQILACPSTWLMVGVVLGSVAAYMLLNAKKT